MAHTALSEEGKKEFFDSPEVLDGKVTQLARWIRESNHMICFTGAGISTGAGIPDYRSGMNTKLQTGPGVWELRANLSSRDDKHKVTTVYKAVPTATHMMLVKLQQEGIMKCCISQNTDGLHRRSGLPKSALCELHGNANLERCSKCGNEYLRDTPLRRSWVPSHLTGRQCDDPECAGPLQDSIIHFGENLPMGELTKGFEEGDMADLCLVMGSSLTVNPAAQIPTRVAGRRQRLVIVNLQRTLLHNDASLAIHAKCEEVSTLLMSKLKLQIPQFKLKRRVVIQCPKADGNGNSLLAISGKDIDGLPFSFFKEIEITDGGVTESLFSPYKLILQWREDEVEKTVNVKILFHNNYGEPPFIRKLSLKKNEAFHEELMMEYSVSSSIEWEATPINGAEPLVVEMSKLNTNS